MKRLAVIVASSTLAIGAHAANWSTVAESQTGSIFSVDLDSIERSDINVLDEKRVDNITVSIRRAYPASKSTTSDSKEGGIHHSDQQWLISCKDDSYYRRAYVYYTADNKVIKSWQSDKPILTSKDFKITSPKTISRMLIEQTCKNYEQAKAK
ncbi:MAG TPA: hypothetical protein VLN09_12040 [Psychrobacter sp.]|uniref:hypothetical protein n=1 Tax=Psychrobacter sp. TaxID=56811 RepID=UPI002C75D6B8|nr:hypothetical protein [Psychrobacter sp.]HSP86444.1 hypothetical protein [Psychrobacter sp.]